MTWLWAVVGILGYWMGVGITLMVWGDDEEASVCAILWPAMLFACLFFGVLILPGLAFGWGVRKSMKKWKQRKERLKEGLR